MHIMEGFLPAAHAVGWSVVALPFVGVGVWRLKQILRQGPETRMLLGLSGAFVFLLSALKLPSVTGSCSHPTGTGLAALLFGPSVVTVLGTLVLLFQALLLAHGGLTTLGANVVSMAVVGPWVTYGIWLVCRTVRIPRAVGIGAAAAGGNLATYVMTSVQLAVAFPDPASGFLGAFTKFSAVFALTQIPLAVVEGLLTVVVVNLLERVLGSCVGDGFRNLGVSGRRVVHEA